MKRLITFILILLIAFTTFYSCKKNASNKNLTWTENQKRKYFQDSIAFRNGWGYYSGDSSLNNFCVFMDHFYPKLIAKNKYIPFVYAFEEPYIDYTNIDKSKNWFRIIIDPCWRIPVCITLEKRNNLTYLTTKITNGHGGYCTGTLLLTLTKVFPDTLYDNISKRLNKMSFGKLECEPFDCDDGETWFFEGIEKGNYNFFIRRCLRSNEKDSSRSKLYSIGCYLLGLGNVFKANYIEAMPWEKDLGLIKSLVDTNDFKRKMIGGL